MVVDPKVLLIQRPEARWRLHLRLVSLIVAARDLANEIEWILNLPSILTSTTSRAEISRTPRYEALPSTHYISFLSRQYSIGKMLSTTRSAAALALRGTMPFTQESCLCAAPSVQWPKADLLNLQPSQLLLSSPIDQLLPSRPLLQSLRAYPQRRALMETRGRHLSVSQVK